MSNKIGAVTLKYFELPGAFSGRGGAVRFFLLRRGYEYKDDTFPMADWPKVKQQLIDSGENLSGHVPVVYQAGCALVEHHAILRRLARQAGEYGADIEADYQVDRLASCVGEWRDALVAGAFGDDAAKESYKATRAGWYQTWERMLEAAGGSGDQLLAQGKSFADDLFFGLLWDDASMFGDAERGPRAQSFFSAYRDIPAVDKWCQAAQAR